MSEQITAIETEYSGHRFRSRLEARWAVFFDKLSVQWLYEPQGYVLGNGERYLPDFWLPRPGVWVEVKGSATEADVIRLHEAAGMNGLPLSYEVGGRPIPEAAKAPVAVQRILLLGEIPRPTGCAWAHNMAVLHGGAVSGRNVFFYNGRLQWIGRGWFWPPPTEHFGGRAYGAAAFSSSAADAYDAARKARFEHGESGYLEPALRKGPIR
jgi:hypothetical protein